MEVSGQLHAPTRFIIKGEAPGTQWTGGWVGPRDGLDVVEKKKMSTPAENRTMVVHPIAWFLY
jgi:hypothetical protein